MSKWIYIQSEPGLWTVGFYNVDERWFSDSDHGSKAEAADRVIELNGGQSRKNRRDRFAAAALTGLLAQHADYKWSAEQTATFAVMAADALIAALDKVTP